MQALWQLSFGTLFVFVVLLVLDILFVLAELVGLHDALHAHGDVMPGQAFLCALHVMVASEGTVEKCMETEIVVGIGLALQLRRRRRRNAVAAATFDRCRFFWGWRQLAVPFCNVEFDWLVLVVAIIFRRLHEVDHLRCLHQAPVAHRARGSILNVVLGHAFFGARRVVLAVVATPEEAKDVEWVRPGFLLDQRHCLSGGPNFRDIGRGTALPHLGRLQRQ